MLKIIFVTFCKLGIKFIKEIEKAKFVSRISENYNTMQIENGTFASRIYHIHNFISILKD